MDPFRAVEPGSPSGAPALGVLPLPKSTSPVAAEDAGRSPPDPLRAESKKKGRSPEGLRPLLG